jgi:hypothetical protein
MTVHWLHPVLRETIEHAVECERALTAVRWIHGERGVAYVRAAWANSWLSQAQLARLAINDLDAVIRIHETNHGPDGHVCI